MRHPTIDAPDDVTDNARSVVAGTEIISASDVDEELRAVARRVLQLATDGIAFDRIAILFPSVEPYARSLDAHLQDADPRPERESAGAPGHDAEELPSG